MKSKSVSIALIIALCLSLAGVLAPQLASRALADPMETLTLSYTSTAEGANARPVDLQPGDEVIQFTRPNLTVGTNPTAWFHTLVTATGTVTGDLSGTMTYDLNTFTVSWDGLPSGTGYGCIAQTFTFDDGSGNRFGGVSVADMDTNDSPELGTSSGYLLSTWGEGDFAGQILIGTGAQVGTAPATMTLRRYSASEISGPAAFSGTGTGSSGVPRSLGASFGMEPFDEFVQFTRSTVAIPQGDPANYTPTGSESSTVAGAMTGTIDHSHNTITLPNATPAFQGWSVGKFTYTGATGAIQGVFVSDLLGGANPSPGYYFATPETGITGSYAGSEYYATVTGTGGTPPTYTLDGNLYTLGAPTGGAPLSGMWTLTDGSGSSTYDPVGATTLTGSVDATLNSTGDVVASTSYTQTYSPSDDLWHLSADLSPATLSISGTPHSGVLYAAGNAPFTPDIEPPGPPGPCIVNADVTGHFGILTTDGSNLFVYATASGSASYTGTWDFGTSTHYINDLSASGDYTGAARGLAIAPQIENVTPGSGTVTLSDGGETVAELDYTTTDSGSIIVAQYDSNPGGAVPATPLGKYIEIDANIIPPEFTWPVELRVYYSDAEVAAAGIEESTLRMYGWNGSSWVQDESGVNTDANYVWARLYHFSPHGPFGSGGATSAPVFPNVWAGIAAAFGLVVAAYVTRRKLTYQQ